MNQGIPLFLDIIKVQVVCLWRVMMVQILNLLQLQVFP